MNKKVKKIAILSTLSTMLLTGCNNAKQPTTQTIIQTTQMTTEAPIAGPTEAPEVTNETIDDIIDEYNSKTNNNINKKDLVIEEYENEIIYMWNKGDEYIYDHGINYTNNGELENCDPSSIGKMYAVIVKENNYYEPIAALAQVNGQIVNVKLTYRLNNETYLPSQNYIFINNPTTIDYENLKNGDEYINYDAKSLTLTDE